MTRILVLGGTSYVAQFVLQHLLHNDDLLVADVGGAQEKVTAIACTVRGRPFSPLPPGFEAAASGSPLDDEVARVVRVYWEVDLLDPRALQSCVAHFRPAIVINCTALSSPAVCQKDREKARALNEPHHLVALLEQLPWQIRLVHFSTDFVYDGTQLRGESYPEDAAVMSPLLSEYGAGKLRFDQFLLEKERSESCRVLILRIANVVGPSAPLFRDRSAPKFMQWLHHQLFLSDATADGQQAPLKLWRDEFRSYLYIHDLVAVLVQLLALKPDSRTCLLNVGGEDALSRVELAQKYLAACATHSPEAAATVVREILPTERAQVDLGYPSPLNTRLDTTQLSRLLPTFTWTPTEQFLHEISLPEVARLQCSIWLLFKSVHNFH